MMDRQHGKIIFECDVCGTTLETSERDFNAARDFMAIAHWKARKIGTAWNHSCAGCGVPGERAPLARTARML